MANSPKEPTQDILPFYASAQANSSVHYASLVPLCQNTCSRCLLSAGELDLFVFLCFLFDTCSLWLRVYNAGFGMHAGEISLDIFLLK